MTTTKPVPKATTLASVSDFALANGSTVHIHPLDTEDLPLLATFRESLESDISPMITRLHCPLRVIPPIPRSHPHWGDQLTLVVETLERIGHPPTICGIAQLYPCAQMLYPYHAEAIIRVEPETRNLGLETELIRQLGRLAHHIGIRTMDVFVPSAEGELAKQCRVWGYSPTFRETPIGEPVIWRLDIPEFLEE